nr:hypothetical protein [Tanacetum cinerariifolium]
MAALRYRDEHNKVGYLLKPTGSDDYHQIIDFLRASYIRVVNSPMLYLLRFEMVINSQWIMPILGTKELASPEQTAPDFLKIIQCCWFEFKYADAAFSKDIPLNMYVVPTGRVVVRTGMYVVPAGSVL